MLDFMKEILGEAYNEEVDKKVSDALGKAFVAKADYNAKNEAMKTLEAQLSEANAAIEDMKAKAPDVQGIQQAADAWKEKAEKAEADREAEKVQYAAELAKRDSRAETEKLLSAHKFINEITKNHYVDAVETALDDPANKGKGREELFKALTQDKEGKPLDGVFLSENPNRLPGPAPAGTIPRGAGDDIAAKVAARYAAAKAE